MFGNKFSNADIELPGSNKPFFKKQQEKQQIQEQSLREPEENHGKIIPHREITRIIFNREIETLPPPSENLELSVCYPVFGEYSNGNVFDIIDAFSKQRNVDMDRFEVLLGINNQEKHLDSPVYSENDNTYKLTSLINAMQINDEKEAYIDTEFYESLDENQKKIVDKAVKNKLRIYSVDMYSRDHKLDNMTSPEARSYSKDALGYIAAHRMNGNVRGFIDYLDADAFPTKSYVRDILDTIHSNTSPELIFKPVYSFPLIEHINLDENNKIGTILTIIDYYRNANHRHLFYNAFNKYEIGTNNQCVSVKKFLEVGGYKPYTWDADFKFSNIVDYRNASSNKSYLPASSKIYLKHRQSRFGTSIDGKVKTQRSLVSSVEEEVDRVVHKDNSYYRDANLRRSFRILSKFHNIEDDDKQKIYRRNYLLGREIRDNTMSDFSRALREYIDSDFFTENEQYRDIFFIVDAYFKDKKEQYKSNDELHSSILDKLKELLPDYFKRPKDISNSVDELLVERSGYRAEIINLLDEFLEGKLRTYEEYSEHEKTVITQFERLSIKDVVEKTGLEKERLLDMILFWAPHLKYDFDRFSANHQKVDLSILDVVPVYDSISDIMKFDLDFSFQTDRQEIVSKDEFLKPFN